MKTAVDGVTKLMQKLSNQMAPTESCDLELIARSNSGSGEEEIRFNNNVL